MKASRIIGIKCTFLIVLSVSMAFLLQPGISATVSVDLYVRDGYLNTVDGRSLPALCYTFDSSGSAALPAPAITLNRGDDLVVTLHNQDDLAHGIEVVGIGGDNSSVKSNTYFASTATTQTRLGSSIPIDLPTSSAVFSEVSCTAVV